MYKNLVVYFFSFSQKTDNDCTYTLKNTDDEMEQPDDRSKCDENR